MIIDDKVLELSVIELHELKLRLAQQYANGILNKENWMRADIALNSIIATKQAVEKLRKFGIETITF